MYLFRSFDGRLRMEFRCQYSPISPLKIVIADVQITYLDMKL